MCDSVRAFGSAPALSSASSNSRYDARCCAPAVGCGYHVRSAHSLLSVANSGVTPSSLARFGLAPRARNVSARSYWPLMIATTIGVDRSPSVGTFDVQAGVEERERGGRRTRRARRSAAR